jgi:regulation of enolase protein 1 (concanavalin A-like superfamily)
MDEQRAVRWDEPTWLNPPLSTEIDGDSLIVTTRNRSDFWRHTAYGVVHDNGHALLTEFVDGQAIEVTFLLRFDTLFDQAGLMVRVDDETWIKAGVELSDGLPQLGAVVTHGNSDWSTAPVPHWAGHQVTIRASRMADAVVIRARREKDPWQLVRLAPLSPTAPAKAGLYCCSPEREGLQVRFTSFTTGPADLAVHEN